MEVVLDEISNGKSLKLMKQQRQSIIDTAKNIKSNDDTFRISTLPEVHDKLLELMDECTNNIRQVEACEKAFTLVSHDIGGNEELDLDPFEELYHARINAHIRDSSLEAEALHDLKSIIKPSDDDIIADTSGDRTWPKDPISKMNIEEAVRNKVCRHLYDRASIQQYISGGRPRKRVPCPVAGCLNKDLKVEDVESDEEINDLIESLRAGLD